ncbi:glycosyltransferase family 4 protein [Bacillus carboniphilus]|uniref:Glycosyltransferase family 4 protein n=1 Tax=Bacillus carboniphilus TaxID=86663 RepID=A0ABY9JX29_9BACI|nr:glycosyltransferase family 4 protein [Bacillus carboniphilus]WLR43946.1 glycosyltransferase family 4 protein [Bacillus carboniphilus]
MNLIQSEIDRKVNILIISPESPYNIKSGIGVYIDSLLRGFADPSVVYTVICPSNVFRTTTFNNHKIIQINVTERDTLQHWVRSFQLNALRWLETQNATVFDLIHVHDWQGAMLGISLRNTYSIPLLVTVHSTHKKRKIFTTVEFDTEGYIEKNEQQILNQSDVIHVASQCLQEELTKHYIVEKSKISIIPLGVYVEGKKEKNEHSKAYVTCVGRTVEEKGFQHVIQSFGNISDKFPSLELVIVGDGPYLQKLKQKSRQYEIENRVRYLGYKPPYIANKIIAKSECVIVPSLYEPFGLVALQSILLQKPVLASKIGGLQEMIVHQENGWFFDHNNSLDLIEKLKWILLYSDLANKQMEQSYDHSYAKYSIEAHCKKMNCLYKQLIM